MNISVILYPENKLKGEIYVRKLRKVREDKGLSLRDVSSDLGVDHSLISLWERSLRSPSEENKIKLELYFNRKIEYLLEEDEHANHEMTVK